MERLLFYQERRLSRFIGLHVVYISEIPTLKKINFSRSASMIYYDHYKNYKFIIRRRLFDCSIEYQQFGFFFFFIKYHNRRNIFYIRIAFAACCSSKFSKDKDNRHCETLFREIFFRILSNQYVNYFKIIYMNSIRQIHKRDQKMIAFI